MKTYDELLALINHWGVHPVFGGSGELNAWIEQNPDELARFLVEMQKLGVQSVLEIGTGYKAGLARFLHDEMESQITSVDIHDYGHWFNGIEFVTITSEDEYDPHAQFDLVIIDGDHRYEYVKRDHLYYAQFATKIIMFHDIAGLRDCEGARDYWREIAYKPGETVAIENEDMPVGTYTFGKSLKSGYHEIIADGDQRGGIGYIVLSETEHHAKAKAPAKKPTSRTKAAAKK